MNNIIILILIVFSIQSESLISRTAESNEKELLENSCANYFSSKCNKDTFSIRLVGSTILNSTAIFSITSSSGEVIYKETFPSIELIGYRADFNDRDSVKTSIIESRLNTFFDPESFLIPAIKESEVFDSDYSNKTIWDEIKSTKSNVGFYYETGEGKYTKIAYSRILQKVVKYFICC